MAAAANETSAERTNLRQEPPGDSARIGRLPTLINPRNLFLTLNVREQEQLIMLGCGNAWYDPADHPYPYSDRRVAALAIQRRLGLLPERRFRPVAPDRDHSDTGGTNIGAVAILDLSSVPNGESDRGASRRRWTARTLALLRIRALDGASARPARHFRACAPDCHPVGYIRPAIWLVRYLATRH